MNPLAKVRVLDLEFNIETSLLVSLVLIRLVVFVLIAGELESLFHW